MDTPQIQTHSLTARNLEIVPCNLCNSTSYSVVYPACYEKEKDADIVQKFRASGDELLIDQLVKCTRCGLQYVSPRFKGKAIVDAYSAGEDPLFISQAQAREKTFYDSLAYIERFIPRKGKVLDVGTAGGSFLAAAQKRGWDVYGCEPNRWLGQWGKKHYGIDIKPGTIFDQQYKNSQFDMVTLWDVIEHTPDPRAVLEECSRVLREDGLLIVNYPDIGSSIARFMGRKWLFLTSVHLYYFTRATMTRMLRQAGFEPIVIKPHFQKLELGYVMFRAGTYSPVISSLGTPVVSGLGLSARQVPYWLGQTFVIAKKSSREKHG